MNAMLSGSMAAFLPASTSRTEAGSGRAVGTAMANCCCWPTRTLLLVLSERGELVSVAATADRFEEIAQHPGIRGKTWNHPALAGDVLLTRNSQEMAAIRLALEAK